MNKEIIIALCAGEASGDLLGAHLIDALKQQYPNTRFVGIGGPRMKAAGLISLYEQDALAVRGYTEILGNLFEILRIRRGLVEDLRKISPHVFVGIDSPDFNLTVAAKLKAAGIPTLHYVSPSVWAWKPERVHKIVRQVNQILCLFPMEPKLYRDAGGKAEYVGHPLAQMLPLENSREAVRERLKLNLTTPVFTLLPGSRVSEVQYMAPVFLRAAALIVKALPEAVFLMPYPSAGVRECLQQYLQQEEFRYLPIRLQAAKTELACIAADVVLVTSGTASLEVALCKRPMVISYRISSLTYALVKRKIKIPYVGLPNILLGKEIVPELLQKDATPEKLANAVLDWYYHPARAAELETHFLQLHQHLRRNTDELAAYAVLTEAGLHLPKPEVISEEFDDIEPQPNIIESELSKSSEQAPQTDTTQTNKSVTAPENLTNNPIIAPPSALVGMKTDAKLVKSTDIPVSLVSPESKPITAEPTTPQTTTESSTESFRQPEKNAEQIIETNQPLPNESDNMNTNQPNSSAPRKSKGGLFGWLSSLFGKKQRPEFEAMQNDALANASDSTIVAVSRAEAPDDAEPQQPTQTAAPTTSSENTQPANAPVCHVIEEEELHVAPVQMVLPKSTILTNNQKPNIFAKYIPDETKLAAATPVVEKATPTIQSTENKNISVSINKRPVAPAIAPEPPKAPSAPQTSSLAKYLTQASMAGLPADKLTKPAQPVAETKPEISVEIESVQITNQPVAETKPEISVEIESVQIANQPVAETKPEISVEIESVQITNQPIVETKPEISVEIESVQITNQPIVETKPEISVEVESVQITNQPIAETKPQISIESVQIANQPVAETKPQISVVPVVHTIEPKKPTITVQAVPQKATIEVVVAPKNTPNVNAQSGQNSGSTNVPTGEITPRVEIESSPVKPKIQTTQVAENTPPTQTIEKTNTVSSVSSEVVKPVETPTPKKSPFAPKTIGENSFASVFRKHTLQTEQAENIDAINDRIEPAEKDEPEQIVVNSSATLSSPPTHADAATDEGLPVPEISNYSINPKRYNNGIFF